MPVRSAARKIASATIADVRAWEGCPFTTTGQPEASAEAVSPPAVEYAKGKLLAPKTATVPIGTNILRKSTFGIGWRFRLAESIRASTHEPSSKRSANIFSWKIVLPLSPINLPSGKLVSCMVV